MPPNDLMFEKLAEGLDSTSRLTHALLTEIRDSEADFAAIKTELGILRENVRSLSVIVREGNGATSLITRIALIDQKLEGIDHWMENHIDTHQSNKDEIVKLKEALEDLARKVSVLEQILRGVKEIVDEREAREQRDLRASITRETELEYGKKKSEISVTEERQKAVIRVLLVVILTTIGVIAFLLTKGKIGLVDASYYEPVPYVYSEPYAEPPSPPQYLIVPDSPTNPMN